MTSDEHRAIVEVTPSVNTNLAVGTHVIYEDNCTINVLVINDGEYYYEKFIDNFGSVNLIPRFSFDVR